MKHKEKKRGNLRRFLPYYKKYIPIIIFDLFCAALTTACELVLPLIVRSITDAASQDISKITVEFIVKVGVSYIVLRIIDTAASYYMATVGHIMGTRLETDMRSDMFAHLEKLPFSYYDNAKVGSIMSRMTNDLFDVTEFAHHCPEEFFVTGIKVIASFSILCTMSAPLTLLIFAVMPPMILILGYFNHKMRDGFRESRRRVGELNSQIEDSLSGIRVVKSFANEDVEKEKFEKNNQGFLAIKRKVYRYMGGFQCSTRFFDGLMYIFVVILGAVFLMNGKISAADFIAFLLYVNTLLTSIRRIVEFGEQFQRGMTGIDRFFEIMDVEPLITDSADATELKTVRGDIEFKNVSFKYSEENSAVLKDFNMKIPAGSCTALVGPSGGGKTTVSALIPRFYEAVSGEIWVDGRNIKGYTLKSLRENIGIVQQDVYLFSGTVKENIAYGKPGASDEEIIKAAKLAGAEEFIETLPDGYNTYVGERGVKLSGGQKQRISVARVFLKNPPILILDEATSALDNESEQVVKQSLARLAKGRTTLIIAHRLTTVKNADTILVMGDGGVILEQGTHDELLEKKGAYFGLYSSYAE